MINTDAHGPVCREQEAFGGRRAEIFYIAS